jgi:hypothetical protein
MPAQAKPSQRSPRVSAVGPAFNEARNLPYVLARVPADIHELILLDGHSVDDTVRSPQTVAGRAGVDTDPHWQGQLPSLRFRRCDRRLHATCRLSEANGRRQALVGRDSARPPRCNTADLSLAGRAYAY